MRRQLIFWVGLALLAVGGTAQAGLIWGNNASGGAPYIQAYDSTTGALVHEFLSPHGGNGRGVVQVGNILYYTLVSNKNIYRMSAINGSDLGSPITTSVLSMSTIGWDGSAFWTSDYTGSKNAYRIDPATGATIKTVSLAKTGHYYDGLEYFNGKLIANRGDAAYGGIYDVYDTNGNLLTADFLKTGEQSTGIAFDGTDFYVSNLSKHTLSVFDGTTGNLLRVLSLDAAARQKSIEDLSFDYAARADTGGGGGPSVPEPGTLALLGLGAFLLAWTRRRMHQH
jgi:DNA-binding beta-propeller fold protein YncE